MQRIAATLLFVFCVWGVASEENVHAETLTDPDLGFELELSPEFVLIPEMAGVSPNIDHVFQYGEAPEGEVPVFLFIEKLGNIIGREHLSMEDLPAGSQAELYLADWQGFEVDGIIVPESENGVEAITYNVQVPLKGEAIQLRLLGPAADHATNLKPLMQEVLAGLRGESSWTSPPPKPSPARGNTYGIFLLCIAIVGFITFLTILWFYSRTSPRGAVFAIAAVIYVASYQLDEFDYREVHMLVGMMRLIGVAGGILGIIDLIRKSPPKPKPQKSNEPTADQPMPQ